MKGFITRTLALTCGAALLATAGCASCGLPAAGGPGCADQAAGNDGGWGYDNFVDPCYPERYNHMARDEVNASSGPQIHNGHVLDQTVWNWMFEPGTDRLTWGGRDHLDYLIRRRPCPDAAVFLQTAQDITYDPSAPEKFPETRCDLDAHRIAAVQKYLTAASAGRHVDWQVAVIDPTDPGISAIPANLSIGKMYLGSSGTLGGGGAAGASGGGGAK